MSFSAYIDTLHENLEDVAWRILHLPADLSILVWVDNHRSVLASEARSAPHVTSEQIVGLYVPGRSAQIFEEDLHAASVGI